MINVALQETWHFPWDLAAPSTLGSDLYSFSLSSTDVTNEIKVGRPYGGITFIWHRNFRFKINMIIYFIYSTYFGYPRVLFIN